MTTRLSAKNAAQHLGISWTTWRGYMHDGRAPQPDGVDETFARPYWLRSTLDKWQASRPRQGALNKPGKESSDLEKRSAS